jgi:hypothetical protein
MTNQQDLPLAQRAYAVACLSAFKGFGLALVGAVLVYMTIRAPGSLFQPGAPLVQQYGLPRILLATQALGGLVVLAGIAWMTSALRAALRLLARIRELRGRSAQG